jgi:predicted DNA-binding transcriptional regulator YafY
MRADRLISLVLLLQEGRSTAARLATELGVSRRTILRDLDALSLTGVPVIAEGGPGGGVWLDQAYRTSLTGLKEAEVKALLVNADGRLLEDLGWGESFRASRRKLEASVPRGYETGIDFVRRRLVLDSRWWWHEPADRALEALQTAVWGDRVVEGEYETWEGARKRVRLEAYGLAAKAGLWYFVARRDGEWRTYRVSRFADVSVKGPFDREPFDLAQWWPEHAAEFATEFSAIRFTIALPEAQVRYLRGIAPGRVDVKGAYESPGWVVAELGLNSALYAELVVLGLGRDCVVLEPAELREAVLRRARDGIAAHGTKPVRRADDGAMA